MTIARLKHKLEQAERDILAYDKPDVCGYHFNLKQVARRDRIARKLQRTLDARKMPETVFDRRILLCTAVIFLTLTVITRLLGH